MSSSLQEHLQLALGDIYLLERELGGGGMSRVFVAHEQALGRRVVVKVLLPELAAAVNVERFRREIQLAAQLQHPHIVPLLSAGEAKGLPYFIMPFVAGESLRARIEREGEFPIADTVRILRNVVSALAYAHEFGVIHRDVKPDNVLLSHGVAVVTDFGVAKALSASSGSSEGTGLTSAGVALGTPAYMAPEQATASPQTDHRADIYALGVMAYELLTGLPPFTGRSAQAVLAAHVIEEPEPVERRRPAVPPMLATLVRECLCKRPADRPQSAAQVMHVLDSIATPSGGTAATTAVRLPVVSARAGTRRRLLSASGAIAALLLAGAAVWWGRSSRSTVALSPAAAVPSVDSVTGVPEVPRGRSLATELPVQPPPPASRVRQAKPRRPATTSPVPAPRISSVSPEEPTPEPPVAAESAAVAAPLLAMPVPPAVDGPPRPTPAAELAPVPAPSAPRPPVKAPTAPADPRPALRSVLDQYAAAIQARSLAELQRVYPGMTGMQQRGWEQFFDLVRDVTAELSMSRLVLSGGSAEGDITGRYTYLNTSTGRRVQQPVSFHATFRSDNGRWRIAAVE